MDRAAAMWFKAASDTRFTKNLAGHENASERSAKVRVEDGIENRVDTGVGVSKPEKKGVQLTWNVAAWAPAVHDVNDEEAEPPSPAYPCPSFIRLHYSSSHPALWVRCATPK